MSFKLAATIRNARSTAILTATDAQTAAGAIHFYSLPLPATTGAAITTQTVLATCALSKPSGAVANAALTFNTISNDLAAAATGAIAFGRLVDGAGNFIADGDAGVSDGHGGYMINGVASSVRPAFLFNTVNTVAGGTVQITNIVINEGNA